MKTIKRFFSSILVFLIIGCLFRVSGTESCLETPVLQSDEKTKCLSRVSPTAQNYDCRQCGLNHIYGQCTMDLVFSKDGTLRGDAPLEFWGKN